MPTNLFCLKPLAAAIIIWAKITSLALIKNNHKHAYHRRWHQSCFDNQVVPKTRGKRQCPQHQGSFIFIASPKLVFQGFVGGKRWYDSNSLIGFKLRYQGLKDVSSGLAAFSRIFAVAIIFTKRRRFAIESFALLKRRFNLWMIVSSGQTGWASP